jgi:hypothetical protein
MSKAGRTSIPFSVTLGLFSPRSEAKMNLRFIGLIALQFTLTVTPALSQVTTSQYDNSRTGATLSEKTLTPNNVNSQHFGKLGAFKVDGPVYAQPLYVPNVEIPGQATQNILYVATDHNHGTQYYEPPAYECC